jgi:hypothetical protein
VHTEPAAAASSACSPHRQKDRFLLQIESLPDLLFAGERKRCGVGAMWQQQQKRKAEKSGTFSLFQFFQRSSNLQLSAAAAKNGQRERDGWTTRGGFLLSLFLFCGERGWADL